MRAPDFWYDKIGWRARAFMPLSILIAFATSRRVANRHAYRARVPVVCVGNLGLGGAGKTPTAIAIVQRLAERDVACHVVTRGYGGRLAGPVMVDEDAHSAADVGDEPLLLAAFTTTWVARNRASGVRAAENAGAQVILLDDGFQNGSVVKDLSVVVVDAHVGFGNGLVVPSGPLREPVPTGLARADVVLSIGTDAAQARFARTWAHEIRGPRAIGHLAPLPTGMNWRDTDVVAFAGIGHPEKFFATLRDLGANVVVAQSLDDHQILSDRLLARLESEANARNAQLVTTEKDAVRLPQRYRHKVLSVPVRLEIDDWAEIDKALGNLGLSAFSMPL